MAVYVYVFLLSAPKPTLTAAFTQYTGVFAAYSHIAGSRRRSANCFNCIRFLVSRGYLCCTVIDIRCFQVGSHTHTQTFELMLTLLFSTHASLYLFFRILIKSLLQTIGYYVTFALWSQFRPSVCRLCVRVVHCTQNVEFFCNIFAPRCGLSICLGCEENMAKIFATVFRTGLLCTRGM